MLLRPAITRRTVLSFAAAPFASPDRIIDIHQHTNYSGRSDDALVAHQRTMGVTTTVLLPAGSKGGLAVDAGGNDSVVALASRLPGEFVYFANELPDIADTEQVLRKYLRRGARGIGEQKFAVASDSDSIARVAAVAQEFSVPVLLHFQHETYNFGIQRFHSILERFPKVNFIGHAQTWWSNIDAKADQRILYPKTKVTPGGLTDRYLSDYPNMYGDLSAGSGLNALMRDEDHARGFLFRHKHKLLFGSDCNDSVGQGSACTGSQTIAAVRRLAPDPAAARMILHDNASRLLRING